MNSPRFSDAWERDMEAKFDNQAEAEKLIDLIAAEFSSDPMSTQCFDQRIVERVLQCAAKAKKLHDLI